MDGTGGEDGSQNDVVNEIQEVEECVQEDRDAMDSVLEEDSRSAASTCDNTGSDVVHKRSWWCLSYTRREKCPSVTSLRQSWFVQEVVHLTRLAVPNSFLVLTRQLFVILTLLMVSHRLGSRELDAVALAQSFAAVTGRSLLVGLSSAADTLCSQTFGFKNYVRVGIIFQRGILILSVASFSVAAMWLVSDSIFLLLQQDLCVVQLSIQFLRLRVLAIPFYMLFIMVARYLQAQSLVWIFVAIGFVQDCVGVLFNSLFLYGTHLGVVGVALSLLMFDILGPVLLIAYIKCRGLHKRTWGGWSWDSLRGWVQFLKFGVAGYLMIAFEWWAFEISTLVTGSIGQVQLAANTAIFQFLNFAYVIPYGYGTAAAIRVGNELGAGNPVAAKRAVVAGVVIESVFAVAISTFFLSTRNVIGRVFTNEESVLEILSPSILACLAAFAMDQLQGVISGVLRGAGKQVLGAVTNFVCYYMVGLPLGICLALLVNLGVVGMWIGISVADTLQTLAYFVYLWKFDWKKLSDQAVRNAGGKSENSKKVKDETENQQELDLKGEGEVIEPTDLKSPLELEEDSSLNESDIEGVESTAPLLSNNETGTDINKCVKETDCTDKKLTRGHKLRLLLTKGSVMVVSCSVLVVGVVLAAVLNYDYSICEIEDTNFQTSVLPTTFHSTSSRVCLPCRTTPLPSPISTT